MNSELETNSTTLIDILLTKIRLRFCNIHLVKALAFLNKFQVSVVCFIEFYLLHSHLYTDELIQSNSELFALH